VTNTGHQSILSDIFTFDLYDSDADGVLTAAQVQKMFREIFGSKVMENENTKA
jgi:Ca2+-binding EF-hand superfamily protein